MIHCFAHDKLTVFKSLPLHEYCRYIKKAVEKLEYVSSDRDERFRIEQIDKARIDHLAEMAANRV